MLRIGVQAEDFDPGAEIAALQAGAGGIGCFVGVVRGNAEGTLVAMTLEHYPGMTESAIRRIGEDAVQRFSLTGCSIIHRFGRLCVGERIVFAGAAAKHRGNALRATEFLIDWLKTRAPFWKQEELRDGRRQWVEARPDDDTAAAAWSLPPAAQRS